MTLHERITAVFAAHHYWGDPYYQCSCECSCEGSGVATAMGPIEHDAHVASEVVRELTPGIDIVAEVMADADDGIIFGLLTPDEAEFYRRMARAAVNAMGFHY